MFRGLHRFLPLVLSAAFLTASPAAADQPSKADAFLGRYCLECHDGLSEEGDRNFEALAFPVDDVHGLIAVQEIIDQLNLGEMPPEEADQPSATERAAAIEELVAMVESVSEQLRGTGAQTVLRRLNRREYVNSLEDLLGRDLSLIDPAASFPTDREVEHMDNIGDALVMSSYLLDRQMEAGDLAVEAALGQVERPKTRNWKFRGNFDQGQELSVHEKVFENRYLCLYAVPNSTRFEGSYGYIHEFQEGVPGAGYYEIELLAQAMHRKNPYDQEIFRMNPEEPFRLAIVPGNRKAGKLHHPQAIEPKLAEVAIRDGKPKWYRMRIPLEAGQTPRFIFPNGMESCRDAFGRIARQYQDHWPEKERGKRGIYDARRIVLTYGKMPHIRIHEIRLRGPVNDTWPPRSQRLVFGEKGFRSERIRAILEGFADRAFRRPPTETEVNRLMKLVGARQAQGRDARESTLDAIKAILCSPAFLYLSEPGRESDGPTRLLGAHDLAARLSYFIWSTLPDAPLRSLADSGEILETEVLLAELDRLLDDPRSEEFERGFTGSWLNLRSLGDMPPDRDSFGVYYAKDLENAMKEETRLFFGHLIRENRPVSELLDADYTFANAPLAELYDLPASIAPEKAHLFQRVSLPDRRRGGLLGMAGVLTVTANGVDTSPITRGVWILENVLGTPPPPPPDVVPVIEPDVRGATTIRDQLEKHREIETCRSCHEKIDPPGFALETYDPIGRWRSRYPGGKKQGPKVDPSGSFPSGETFDNIVEFKDELLRREDLFIHMLTEKLLTYAIGRRIEVLDRPTVDRIASSLTGSDRGMRTLLHEVVASDIFRSR